MSLADALFPKTRQRVLGLLFSAPKPVIELIEESNDGVKTGQAGAKPAPPKFPRWHRASRNPGFFRPPGERSRTWSDNANDQQERPVYRFHPFIIEAAKRFAGLGAR